MTEEVRAASGLARAAANALQEPDHQLGATPRFCAMAVLSIFLRQRESPTPKRVGTPHDATGVEG